MALFAPPFENRHLKARTLGYWSWGLALAGKCRRAERQCDDSERVARDLADSASESIYSRNLGLALALQGRHSAGIVALRRSVGLAEDLGSSFIEIQATSNALLAMALTQAGEWQEAAERLDDAHRIKQQVGDVLGMPDTNVWRGNLLMAEEKYEPALQRYRESLTWKWTGRRHCESEARVGISRALYLLKRPDAALAEIAEAERGAAAYPEHAAALSTLKGHIALGSTTSKKRAGSVATLYLAGLVNAMRHNRFALDRTANEVLAKCRAATTGAAVLEQITAVWRTGYLGPSGIDVTNAPESGTVPLVELERQARAAEPGDGRRQSSVLDILKS